MPPPVTVPTALPATGKPAYLGMWVWVWQRASSLVLFVLLPWHWLQPFNRPVRIAVLFFVVFHAMAGLRVMLTDFGVAERWQRALAWTLAGLGGVIFLFFLQYA